jgi:hypothetical protein
MEHEMNPERREGGGFEKKASTLLSEGHKSRERGHDTSGNSMRRE